MNKESTQTIQFINSSVSAGTGFPSPSQDYMESSINWNEILVKHPASTFIVRVLGDSMMPLIHDQSLIVVDRSLTPKHKDIIVALINDEFTVKRYMRTDKNTFLVPENPSYTKIKIEDSLSFECWGVVTYTVLPLHV